MNVNVSFVIMENGIPFKLMLDTIKRLEALGGTLPAPGAARPQTDGPLAAEV